MKLHVIALRMLVLSGVLITLTSCGGSPVAIKKIESISHCSFSVPDELYKSSEEYRNMMIDTIAGDYSKFEDLMATRMEYSNFFSLTSFDGSFSLTAYQAETPIEHNSLTAQSINKTIEDRMNELSFEVGESGESWGIDTSSDFYSNMKYDIKKAERKKEGQVEYFIVPYSTSVSYSNGSGQEGENPPLIDVPFEGWLSIITNNKEDTKILSVYNIKNENAYDIESIAKSFIYDSSIIGSKRVFDNKEIESIHQESFEVMSRDLKEMDFETK